jgi:hypothetical protein
MRANAGDFHKRIKIGNGCFEGCAPAPAANARTGALLAHIPLQMIG